MQTKLFKLGIGHDFRLQPKTAAEELNSANNNNERPGCSLQLGVCILTTTTRYYRIRLFTEQSLDRISFRCVYIYGRFWGAGSCRILYTCQREYVERGVAAAELVPRIAHAHGAVGVPAGWHIAWARKEMCPETMEILIFSQIFFSSQFMFLLLCVFDKN